MINPFDFFEPYAEASSSSPMATILADLAAYRQIDEDGPLLDAALAELALHGERTIDFLVGLNA